MKQEKQSSTSTPSLCEENYQLINEVKGQQQISISVKSQTKDSNLKKLYLLTFSFVVLFTAYNPIYMINSEIYSQIGHYKLGMFQIVLNSFSFGANSLFAGYFMKKYSIKGILVFSSFGYIIFILSGFNMVYCVDNPESNFVACNKIFSYTFVLVGTTIQGILACLVWVAQPAYIDSLLQNQPENKGKYFGTFFSIYQFNSIFGNIISMVLLSYFGRLALYFSMALLSLIAIVLFFFLPPVEKVKQTTKNKNAQSQSELAISNKKKEVEDLKSEIADNQESLKETLKKFMDIFKIKSIRYLMGFMGLNGINSAVVVGFLHILIERSLYQLNPQISENIVETLTTFSFLVNSLTGIVTGIIIGILIDKFQVQLTSLGSLLSNMMIFELVLILINLNVENFLLCILISMFQGCISCCQNTLTYVIISKYYNAKFELYSLFNLMWAVVNVLMIVCQLTVQTYSTNLYIIFLTLFSFVINITFFKFHQLVQIQKI